MTKDLWMGILIVIFIFSISFYGSSGKTGIPFLNWNFPSSMGGSGSGSNSNKEVKDATTSSFKNTINISSVNRSSDAGQEYITIQVSGSSKTPIDITGWTLKSTGSGSSVTIPKGTYLFFAGQPNVEENISLVGGDTLYLVTGYSPNGASFKENKCSGYLTQFQTFTPSINNNCPSPKNEDLSSIPRITINDACLDYIKSYPSCRIQTESLPANWSYECTKFIYDKINYPSCVNAHKNDSDFYGNTWRVYLKRSEKVWKASHENIVLLDNTGKIVDTYSY